MSVHYLWITFISKYIMPASTSGEMMSISPVSPIIDDDYVECRNELNTLNTLESMDETDFPRNTLNRVFCCGTENESKSSSKGTRGFLTHPGSAVKITTSTITSSSSSGTDSGIVSISQHIVDDKVGNTTSSAQNRTNNSEPSTKTSTKALDTQRQQNSPNSTAKATQREPKNTKDLQLSVAELAKSRSVQSTPATVNKASSQTTAASSSAGRISPSKSYDDMIKFVFTEHGIKVISDREYVV